MNQGGQFDLPTRIFHSHGGLFVNEEEMSVFRNLAPNRHPDPKKAIQIKSVIWNTLAIDEFDNSRVPFQSRLGCSHIPHIPNLAVALI